jgi:hypothetical protein
VVGGVVFDSLGLQAAFGSQLLPTGLALGALLLLLPWDKRPWRQQQAGECGPGSEGAAPGPQLLSSGASDCGEGLPEQQQQQQQEERNGESSSSVCAQERSAGSSCGRGCASAQRPELRQAGRREQPGPDLTILVVEGEQQQQQHGCGHNAAKAEGGSPRRPAVDQRPSPPASSTSPKAAAAAAASAPRLRTASAAAPAPARSPARAVWDVVRCLPVLKECWLIFACQVARTALDLLVPLVLAGLSASSVAIVFAAEALGSVAAPFVADAAVQEGRVGSRRLATGTMLVMAGTCGVVLLAGHRPLCRGPAGLCPGDPGGGPLRSVPWGLAAGMLLFGACHSSAETLVFGHLAELLDASQRKAGGERQALSSDVTMNVYGGRRAAPAAPCSARAASPLPAQPCSPAAPCSERPRPRLPRPAVLCWVLGFTVGAYAAGIPRGEVFWQQAATAGALGLVVAASALAVNGPYLLRRRLP